jgi:hypothetical protein
MGPGRQNVHEFTKYRHKPERRKGIEGTVRSLSPAMGGLDNSLVEVPQAQEALEKTRCILALRGVVPGSTLAPAPPRARIEEAGQGWFTGLLSQ